MRTAIRVACVVIVLRLFLPRLYGATETFLLALLGKATQVVETLERMRYY